MKQRVIQEEFSSEEIIKLEATYGAHNYHPIDVVIQRAQGIWMWDPEGRRYMDMLSAYSAVNQGHRHPEIIKAASDQLGMLTLTSRAFYNTEMAPFLRDLCKVAEMEMALPMNTGAEAVETAIKLARKWGYEKKGVASDKAEIIVCAGNFHGRTTTIVSFSSDPDAYAGFGPRTPGFQIIPFDDTKALEDAITENTVAFMVEPIQGENGVIIPGDGYLRKVREICSDKNVLMILDEVQTGFCRTGEMFAFQHEGVKPDVLIVGKALGGGVYPVSAVLSSREIMEVFTPGTHGSTFGGNPLASAVGIASLNVLLNEELDVMAKENGKYFVDKLKALNSEKISEIRGRGLLIAIDILKDYGTAREYVNQLKDQGLLCKDTHGQTLRFAPPLVITKDEIDQAMEIIQRVFEE